MEPNTTCPDAQILSMPRIIRKIPADCLRPNLTWSLYYLIRDLMMAAGLAWAIVVADSWWVGLPLSILLGLVIGGLFVIGHDCGHRSFCRSEKWNNFFGHLASSITLWPFHIWRMDHDAHHRHTDHIDLDPAWRPVTYRMWLKLPRTARWVYIQTRSRFFFLGSLYTTWQSVKLGLTCGKNPKLSPAEKMEIRFSLGLVGLFTVSEISAALWFGGFYGLVCLFVIPQLVFHSQLSTATFFHHTSPDSKFLDRREWTMEKAQLAGSIHVSYPRWVEFFWHDINWHVPHHVCVGVPHYKLRKAHAALKQAFPDIVREKTFSWSLIRETLAQCHFIKSKAPADLSWTSLSEARALAEANPRRKPGTTAPTPATTES